jgi:hypothetical protein
VAVAATVLLLVVAARKWPDLPLQSDFVAFWTGGWLVRDGAGSAFFDTERQRAVQTALRQVAAAPSLRLDTSCAPFLNPPPLALFFVPLTLLRVQQAFLVWTGLSFVAFVVSVAVQLRGASNGKGLAVMLLTFGGVTVTLGGGQVNGLFLLAFSLALLALRRDKQATGGALLGILWLKPQYAVPFALLLLLKRRWRELSGMAGTAVATSALSLTMVGPTGILDYLREMQRISAFRPPPDALVSPQAMVNWRAMLLNLWPDVPDNVGAALVLLLGGATILVALLAWRGEWAPGSPLFARQMLVLTLATILASPHSHFHGAVLMLAPVSAMLARSPAGVAPVRGWRTLLVGGLLLSVSLVPFAPLRWLMAPYLLAGLGMLLLGRPVPLKSVASEPAGDLSG